VRLLVAEREHPGRITIHWLTDDEAADLAEDLASLDESDCDDCGRPERACRCVAYSTEPSDDHPFAA
jgi:hypothetical protein